MKDFVTVFDQITLNPTDVVKLMYILLLLLLLLYTMLCSFAVSQMNWQVWSKLQVVTHASLHWLLFTMYAYV